MSWHITRPGSSTCTSSELTSVPSARTPEIPAGQPDTPQAKPDAALEGPGHASISPGHRRGAKTRNRRGAHIWAEPASGPPCAGVCGQACTLSLDGSGNPGTASAEDPRCVFCSADRFQQLARQQNGGMVTFYLSRLEPLHQKEALRTIEIHGGSAMRLSYVTRLKRQLHNVFII